MRPAVRRSAGRRLESNMPTPQRGHEEFVVCRGLECRGQDEDYPFHAVAFRGVEVQRRVTVLAGEDADTHRLGHEHVGFRPAAQLVREPVKPAVEPVIAGFAFQVIQPAHALELVVAFAAEELVGDGAAEGAG